MQVSPRRTVGPLPVRPAGHRGAKWAESLEPRVMLAVAPAGPEFQANATTRGTQWQPAVAADADGDFVVVWRGSYQDETRGGVYARRFDRTGAPRGGDFRVNSTADTRGETPAVAMDADGDFVVAWSAPTPNGDNPTVVYARRYSAAGTAQGAPFAVAATATGSQRAPSIAVDDDGDFVVAWENYELPSTVGIYARRFDSAGAARGDVFRVSTRTFGQTEASVAMDADGDFVVVWDNYEFGGADWDTLRGRRYDAGGAALGDEFRVDVDPGPQPTDPAVAMDANGDFAVAWESYTEGNVHIRARRFSADGAGGEELRVSSADPDGAEEHRPAVDLDADGDMVVVWNGGYNPEHVFARYYPAAGPAGAPIQVDTAGVGERDGVRVAADADGDFVVAWAAYQQEDRPGHEVMARRFGVSDVPPATTVVGRHVFYNDSAYDGSDEAADERDGGAIATDKAALLPGRAASFANVTGYDKGINGVMVDLYPAAVRQMTAGDFEFHVSGAAEPSGWTAAPAPASLSVRLSPVPEDPARVTLTWAPSAITNAWLRVTVKANGNTGLAAPDVFSFGNLVGEAGDGTATLPLRVSALDLAAVKQALFRPATVTTATDFNRDGMTNALDVAVVKRALSRSLPLPPPIAAFADGAPAPEWARSAAAALLTANRTSLWHGADQV